MKKCLRLISFFIAAVLLSISFSCKPESLAVQISLDKTDLQLEIGKSERLIAGFEPATADYTAHTWKSTDPEIASVDETGLVTGLSFGNCEIIVTALSGGSTASCEVRVLEKIVDVEKVVLNKTKLAMSVGEKQTLVANIIPQNATNTTIRWATDDEKIATVEDGEVTAVSVGVAEISAISHDGKKYATCVVEVLENTVTFSEIEISNITSSSAYIEVEAMPVGLDVNRYGICYSKSAYPTIEDSKKESRTASMAMTINNLESYTKYYVRAYAVTDDQVYYSKNQNFTTNASLVTNFKVKEVHDGRDDDDKFVVMTSPAVTGYPEVNVCYGTEPEPTITDNIAVGAVSSETGEIEVVLSEKSDIMYMRSYQKMGSSIIYSDDEVEIVTNKVELSYEWDVPIRNQNGLDIEIQMSYTIHKKGTYEVYAENGKVYKGTVVDNLFYVSEGTGQFTFLRKGRMKGDSFENNDHIYYIIGSDFIHFTNIDTNESYIFHTPSRYIYKRS